MPDSKPNKRLVGRHHISVRHLEVFWAVVRTGSQAGAASMLDISQPAVSKVIKYIEQRTGLILFYRSRGRLLPTTEGQVFYSSVEEVFDRVASAERIVDDLQHRMSGECSIAFSPGLGSGLIAQFLAAFRKSNKTARLRLKLLPPPVIAERLLRREIDLGVFHGPLGDSSVRHELLSDDNIVCVLPEKHPLASLASISPKDLNDMPLLSGSVTGPEAWMHDIRATFLAEGLEYDLAIECHHSQHVHDMVAAGLGVGLVPPMPAADVANLPVVVRPFVPRVASPLIAMLPANLPPAQVTTLLINSMRKVLRGKD